MQDPRCHFDGVNDLINPVHVASYDKGVCMPAQTDYRLLTEETTYYNYYIYKHFLVFALHLQGCLYMYMISLYTPKKIICGFDLNSAEPGQDTVVII